MRVFLTGASGFVGSAVLRELLDSGHQVLGLARSEASARSVAEAGAEVHLGSLDDLDSLRRGASAADGVIHTAFIHDFSDLAASCRADIRAIETIGDALAGSGRPFVVTSGMCFDAPGRPGTEADPGDPAAGWRLRVPSEVATLALAARGVRASVLRLPPSVHGRQLGVPVLGVSTEGAADHFGWFVHFFGSDKPTSSSRTRERLGWRPIQPGLIADVDRPSYFTT